MELNKYFFTCRACGGDGKVEVPDTKMIHEDPQAMRAISCGECLGNGFIPSDEGEQLFNFLQKLKGKNLL